VKKLILALLLVLTAFPAFPARAGGFCVDEPVTDRRGDSVDMKDYCFFPNVLRINAGDSVTFENFDAEAHTVTGVGLWGSGHKEYATGDKATFAFENEGMFLYSCLLHPGMVGAIVVGDGKGEAASGTGVIKAAGEAPRSAPAEQESSNNWLYVLAVLGVVAVLVLFVFLARARRSSTAPTVAP
jgi:plastocyanin